MTHRDMLMVVAIAVVVTLPFATFIAYQYGGLVGFVYALVFSFAIAWLIIHRKRSR